MTRARLIRGLRIAWSVWWGIVCVLLVVLWVRSFRTMDVIDGPLFRTVQISAESRYGTLILGCYRTSGGDWYAQNVTPAYQWNNERLKVTAGPPYAYGWVAVPHPLAIFALAMIGAAPWVNWSRQFRLRALLIATTLLAVVLGMAVWSFGR